jgi:hypothetical protein
LTDLHWDETPFRPYDAQLGRFHGVDLLADMFPGITPMHFGYNNPVMFNDPTGLAAEGDGDLGGIIPRKKARRHGFGKGGGNVEIDDKLTAPDNGQDKRVKDRGVVRDDGGKRSSGGWQMPDNATRTSQVERQIASKKARPGKLGRRGGGGRVGAVLRMIDMVLEVNDYFKEKALKETVYRQLEQLLGKDWQDIYNGGREWDEEAELDDDKDDNGKTYMIYETRRDYKKYLPDHPATTALPYFGITSATNLVGYVDARYSPNSIQGRFAGQLFGTQRFNKMTARGIEEALILLNTPGLSVYAGTRIDNRYHSTAMVRPVYLPRLVAGLIALYNWGKDTGKDWMQVFKR